MTTIFTLHLFFFHLTSGHPFYFQSFQDIDGLRVDLVPQTHSLNVDAECFLPDLVWTVY